MRPRNRRQGQGTEQIITKRFPLDSYHAKLTSPAFFSPHSKSTAQEHSSWPPPPRSVVLCNCRLPGLLPAQRMSVIQGTARNPEAQRNSPPAETFPPGTRGRHHAAPSTEAGNCDIRALAHSLQHHHCNHQRRQITRSERFHHLPLDCLSFAAKARQISSPEMHRFLFLALFSRIFSVDFIQKKKVLSTTACSFLGHFNLLIQDLLR